MNKVKSILSKLLGAGKSGGASVGKAVTSRQAQYGTNTLISILVLAGILVLLNLMVRNQTWRWDVTKNKVYSLSPETERVLKNIKDPVTAYAFFTAQYQQPENKDLLKEYTLRNKKIKVEYVDPYKNQQLAIKYGLKRDGTLVLVQGNKSEQTTNLTEQDITSALIRLTNSEKVQVTFWVGNGEKDTDSFEATGYSELKDSLTKLNYNIVKQNPVNDAQIASGTGVLVLAGPQNPYSNKAKETLDKYLSGGGRALIMLDPTTTLNGYNIEDVLNKYGVEVKQGYVIETNPENFFGNPLNVGVYQYPINKITENLGLTVYPRSLMVRTASKTPENAQLDSLANTSTNSWLRTRQFVNNEFPAKDEKAGDISGPISLGMAMRFKAPAGKQNESAYKTRLVVIGDSDLVTNDIVQPAQNKEVTVAGNLDVVVNSINWLTARESLMSIVPKDRTAPTLTLSEAQGRQIWYTVLVVLPIIPLLVGFIVWRMRRRNKVNK
jgi:ABC-type uncharacterized transport system involved in gliding motility auxiliary subunit